MNKQNNHLEKLICEFTNVERRRHNLCFLQYNRILANSAFIHSNQMARHQFFSHENECDPRFDSLKNRVLYATIKTTNSGQLPFRTIGENIADYPMVKQRLTTSLLGLVNISTKDYIYNLEELAQSVVEGWMNSPGHRANILNPDFNNIGCGAIQYIKNNSTTYFKLTQNFGKN